MEFLGLMVNSVDVKYYVPESKKQSICDLICSVFSSKKVLIKLCGKLQFCFKAFGPKVKF